MLTQVSWTELQESWTHYSDHQCSVPLHFCLPLLEVRYSNPAVQ